MTLHERRPDDWLEFRNESSGAHWPLVGEDARLFRSPSSGKIWINWCSRHGLEEGPKKLVHFYYGELKAVDPTTNYKNLTESLYVAWPPFAASARHESSPRDQKNWPIFEYEGVLLFIARIHPLRVVSTAAVPFSRLSEDYSKGKTVFAHTISLTASPNYCWNWGEPRGGTPALLVGSEYLAFFHSFTFMNSRIVRTYFVGAYTFSAAPPFRLTSMSRFPIVAPGWTQGFTYADIDFVPYPMSFTYDDRHVNMSHGWEEGEGWLLTMDRKALFESLVRLDSVVLGECDRHWDWHAHGSPHETFQYRPDWHDWCIRYGGSKNCANIWRKKL